MMRNISKSTRRAFCTALVSVITIITLVTAPFTAYAADLRAGNVDWGNQELTSQDSTWIMNYVVADPDGNNIDPNLVASAGTVWNGQVDETTGYGLYGPMDEDRWKKTYRPYVNGKLSDETKTLVYNGDFSEDMSTYVNIETDQHYFVLVGNPFFAMGYRFVCWYGKDRWGAQTPGTEYDFPTTSGDAIVASGHNYLYGQWVPVNNYSVGFYTSKDSKWIFIKSAMKWDDTFSYAEGATIADNQKGGATFNLLYEDYAADQDITWYNPDHNLVYNGETMGFWNLVNPELDADWQLDPQYWDDYGKVKLYPYYTLSYNANGAQGKTADTFGMVDYDTHNADFEVAESTFKAPKGKKFKGWNTQADGQGDSYKAGDVIEQHRGNMTLYAIWEDDLAADSGSYYTLTYEPNGGDVINEPTLGLVNPDTNCADFTVALVKYGLRCAPAGKRFKEWNTRADGQGDSYKPHDVIRDCSGNMTLYATWEDYVAEEEDTPWIMNYVIADPTGENRDEELGGEDLWDGQVDEATGYGLFGTMDENKWQKTYFDFEADEWKSFVYNGDFSDDARIYRNVETNQYSLVFLGNMFFVMGYEFSMWNENVNWWTRASGEEYDLGSRGESGSVPGNELMNNGWNYIYGQWQPYYYTVVFGTSKPTGYISARSLLSWNDSFDFADYETMSDDAQGINKWNDELYADYSADEDITWHNVEHSLVYNGGTMGFWELVNPEKKADWRLDPQNWEEPNLVYLYPYYTLSYDANGGQGATADTLGMVDYDTHKTDFTVAESKFRTPAGKKFKGWNTQADGQGDSYKAGDVIEGHRGNMTLYAIYENDGSAASDTKVTYTYSANQADWGTVALTYSGGASAMVSEQVGQLTGTPEGAIAEPSANYDFLRWESAVAAGTDVAAGSQSFTPAKTATVDGEAAYGGGTYTAVFGYHVKFDYNGGLDGAYANSVVANMTDSDGTSVMFPNPKRQGYALVGWSTSKNDTPTSGTLIKIPNVTVTQNTTYYAIWDKIATITYEVAESDSAYYNVASSMGAVSLAGTSDKSSKVSESLNESDAVSSFGGATATSSNSTYFRFVGWSIGAPSAKGGTIVSTDATFVPTRSEAAPYHKSATYYANFEHVKYTVKYEPGIPGTSGDTDPAKAGFASGDTGTMFTVNAGAMLPAYNAVRVSTATPKGASGYEFAGWRTVEGTAVTLPSKVLTDATYYASWRVNESGTDAPAQVDYLVYAHYWVIADAESGYDYLSDGKYWRDECAQCDEVANGEQLIEIDLEKYCEPGFEYFTQDKQLTGTFETMPPERLSGMVTLGGDNNVFHVYYREKSTYTISFGMNLGDDAEHGTTSEAIADQTGQNWLSTGHAPSSDPVRPGYEFVGWNTKPDGSGIALSADLELADLANWLEPTGETVQLYAQWKEKHADVKYVVGEVVGADGAVGGYVVLGDGSGQQGQSCSEDVPMATGDKVVVGARAVPAEGYQFKHWLVDYEFDDESDLGTQSVTRAMPAVASDELGVQATTKISRIFSTNPVLKPGKDDNLYVSATYTAVFEPIKSGENSNEATTDDNKSGTDKADTNKNSSDKADAGEAIGSAIDDTTRGVSASTKPSAASTTPITIDSLVGLAFVLGALVMVSAMAVVVARCRREEK